MEFQIEQVTNVYFARKQIKYYVCMDQAIIALRSKSSYIDKTLKITEYCLNEIALKDIKTEERYLSSLKYIGFELLNCTKLYA